MHRVQRTPEPLQANRPQRRPDPRLRQGARHILLMHGVFLLRLRFLDFAEKGQPCRLYAQSVTHLSAHAHAYMQRDRRDEQRINRKCQQIGIHQINTVPDVWFSTVASFDTNPRKVYGFFIFSLYIHNGGGVCLKMYQITGAEPSGGT